MANTFQVPHAALGDGAAEAARPLPHPHRGEGGRGRHAQVSPSQHFQGCHIIIVSKEQGDN